MKYVPIYIVAPYILAIYINYLLFIQKKAKKREEE